MIEQNKLPPFFIVCVFATLFLGVFYYTITNMAGIYIVSELGGSPLISIYAMAFFILGDALGIPLASPIADRLGPIKFVICSLFLFAFFSILCSLASTFFLLNIFRMGLGFSAGFFYITCRRLIYCYTSDDKLKSCTFIMLLFYMVVPLLGACVGAFVAYHGNWRWLFYFQLPISIALICYFWSCSKLLDHPQVKKAPFDTVGYIFYALGISTLFTALVMGQELDWQRSRIFLTLITIGISCTISFGVWNHYNDKPLLDLKLFTNPMFSYAFLNLAILFSVYFGMIILITLWLHIYVKYTVLWIALLLVTMASAIFIAFFVGRIMLKKYDPRITLLIGLIALGSSCYYSTYFNVRVDFFHLSIARFLSGIGIILFALPLLQIAYSSFPEEKSRNIFVLFQMIRALFSGMGASFFIILWQWRNAFFYERLGEKITINSFLTNDYFQLAIEKFSLSKDEALAKLNDFLQQQSTSLALNDLFGFMGYIILGLILLLLFSFLLEKIFQKANNCHGQE